MPMIDGPDCRLYVEILGDGAPVTVFAHGVTSSIEELRPFARHVAGTRVLFDLRGHGRSEVPPPDAGYDHAAMAHDLSFVADRFAATRAWGTSMGAGALMRIVAARPDRFERLAMFIPASIDAANLAATDLFPREARLLETVPLATLSEQAMSSDGYAPLFAARPYWRELVRKRFLRMNADGVPRALRAFVDGGPPIVDGEALRAVRAPVLILAHDGDDIHPAQVARRLTELFPDARLELWPETLAMFDDLDATARLVADFFAG